ncbi:sigma-54-dependent transcriptional regulator [Novispirillum itersonii]|uniref:DNA-binding NtrC family response regulator n=1 Tax=Novispirillum itersonii TaxID=189 RepID=A0A7W9ZDU8_NOVIT|nr:sigma-54 dependent transcriptional regulator [Novispirillum itersonii]MBB6209368.1 DNA-binding NtrC family response regulator [Novispirillum itersonii]
MADVHVLIIDDEETFVRSLRFALKAEGMTVRGAHSGEDGLEEARRQRPDIVLLDLRLPGIGGMETLTALRELDGTLPVVMISAHGDTRAAVQAVKLGAVDYLTKPFELDELLHTIAATLDQGRVAEELDYHRRRDVVPVSGLIGDSAAMLTLRGTVDRIATSSASRILLLGESGTGKAVVARAIHTQSPRRSRAFVEVNCAALPEHLIESELFGAEKGAYTGAHQKRTGLVTLADGGTLFLDEIGELPLTMQAKVLHFLENGTYRAVGSGRSATADARVVAATNRDLAEDVRQGRFREDLFYRLNVITIGIPALRDRGEDVVVLATHFAARQAAEEGCRPVELTPAAQDRLRLHRWPGNVRELKNLMERLTILYPGQRIEAEDLPPEIAAAPAVAAATADAGPPALTERLESAERDLVLDALHRASGHKGRAADLLGISRHALKRRLQRLGLS